jgi:hypothetical protein
MRLPRFRSLGRCPSLPHPVFQCAPRDWTVGLQNPASRDSVWERGDTAAANFFPNFNNLFGNTGDNVNKNPAGSAATGPYVILSFLYQILLELLVLPFDLVWICSSSLLVCMASLISVLYVMYYLLFFWIKSYSKLLIFSTDISTMTFQPRNISSIYSTWCVLVFLFTSLLKCLHACSPNPPVL